MIKGISKKAVAYVLEEDRDSMHPTYFWIRPKDGHMMNESAARYAPASKEMRGQRMLDVKRLDVADIEEFLNTVEKVENYQFPEDHPFYEKYPPEGIIKETDDPDVLKEVCRTMSAAHLSEIWEVAADASRLRGQEKKKLSSSSGSGSGKAKTSQGG